MLKKYVNISLYQENLEWFSGCSKCKSELASGSKFCNKCVEIIKEILMSAEKRSFPVFHFKPIIIVNI